MSAIAPIDPNTPPKNGRGYWVYVDPETHAQFEHPYFDQTRRYAENHRLANNLPVGVAWRDQFAENVCRNTPGAECHDMTPPPKPTMAQMLTGFTKAATTWAASGFKVLDHAGFVKRREICHECDFWRGDGALFGLGQCGKCGCSGLKLFLPSEKCPIGKW